MAGSSGQIPKIPTTKELSGTFLDRKTMRKDRSKMDEISSTERLLEVIRGNSSASQPGTAGHGQINAPGVPRRWKPAIKNPFPARRQVAVGIDFGPGEVRLAKVSVGPDRKAQLLDLRWVTCPSQDSANFSEFLREAVLDFARPARNYSLWALAPSSHEEIRHLRVPKVAKKQIFNAVYWTMKKEVDFDDKSVFDFDVQGEVWEKGVTKLQIRAYTIPAEEARRIKDIFSNSGLPLSGITLSPFVTQNLFQTGWMPGSNDSVACLHIEDDISRIHIFSNGHLILTRTIKTGLNSMAECLVKSTGTARMPVPPSDALPPGPGPLEIAAPPDGAGNPERDRARNLLISLSTDSGHRLMEGTEEEELFRAIGPAVERLARQIEMTLHHHSKTADSMSVSKIYISGVLQNWERLSKYLGEQLGLQGEVLDPLSPEMNFQSDVILPASINERLDYSSALGLALSNTFTPNLLFTYSEKQESEKIAFINRSIAVASFFIMCVLAGVYIWQGRIIEARRHELANLQQQLARYNPPVDQNMIVQTEAKAKSHIQSLRELSRGFMPMAVLSELSALTPQNVRLIGITMDLAGAPAQQAKGAAAGSPAKEPQKTLIVDGIVRGDRLVLEATLARYLMRLGFSAIFADPAVQSSKIEFYQDEGEVLRFMLTIGLV